MLKIEALSFDAHSLVFFPNFDFKVINCVDKRLESGVFYMRKQVIIKRRKIWRSCTPEFATDQSIVKKFLQITKSLPCCIGCSLVLLKIPTSQFIIVELIDENTKNVLPVPLSCYSIFKILSINSLTS
jgi:hypothetical protein